MDTINIESSSEQIKNLIREVLSEQKQPAASTSPAAVKTISKGEQRILNSMNWLETITHRDAFPALVVAYFARTSNMVTYSHQRKQLRQQHYVENTYGGFMKLTDIGRRASVTTMSVGKTAVLST
jgi:hypothetical protein